MLTNFPYFWIDDAFITGNLREAAGIHLIDLDEYFTIYKGHMECCIATPRHSPTASFSSSTKIPYWCDYVVGPTNDDLNLYQILHSHSKFCHTSNTCQRREGRNKLNFKCIVTPDMIVNNFNHVAKSNNTNNRKRQSDKHRVTAGQDIPSRERI